MELELKTVVASTVDGVTTVRMNRPEKRNAMSPQLHRDMYEALSQAKFDEDTKVVIVTGTGDSFCAGQDLKEYFAEASDDPREREADRMLAHEWRHRLLYYYPKPTIASINGWCFGGAFTIVASCDIAIAADEAVFGLSEVNWGSIPGGLVAKVVADLLSPRQALYYSMTGETFDGKRAAEIGFATMSVPRDQLAEKTQALADTLKEKRQSTVAAIKRAYRAVDIRSLSFEDAFRWLNHVTGGGDRSSGTGGNSQRGNEGIQRFLDKEYRPGLGAMPQS